MSIYLQNNLKQIKPMDKSNTKKPKTAKSPYLSLNPAIIARLIQKYGLSRTFIGQSLRGERTSETSLKICEDYKRMNNEIKKTIANM